MYRIFPAFLLVPTSLGCSSAHHYLWCGSSVLLSPSHLAGMSLCSGWVDPLLMFFFFGPCLFSLLDLLKSFPNFLHWKINFSSLLCINMEGHYYLVWVILLAVYFHYLSILITFKIFCYCFSSMNYLSFKI